MLPFSADNASAVAAGQQQQQQQQLHTALPNNAEFQLQQHQQQITLENDPELKQQLQQLQHLQQQQQHSNARIIKAVAAAAGQQQQQQQPATNFIYNVESGDKNAAPVQLLFQLPPAMSQQQQQQSQQQLGDQASDQQQQQQQSSLQHCNTDQQQQPHLFRAELEQVAQELLVHQRQSPAVGPVVGVQTLPMPQGMKQKHFNLQEQLLLHPPPHMQAPTCSQHQVLQVRFNLPRIISNHTFYISRLLHRRILAPLW